MEFTFLVLSYNQEQYIIEHLESIKYQILNYGKDYAIRIVVCDDCSTDCTVKHAEEWLEKNVQIGFKYEIAANKMNLGTVKNYLKAVGLVKNGKFKLLAADDLYYKYNIFDVIQTEDILFTPLIKFGLSINPLKKEDLLDMYTALECDTLQQIRKRLKYENIFNAPGAFIKPTIINDDINFKSFMSDFRIIEDLPEWYYMFFRKPTLSFKVGNIPYILYRTSSGVSTGNSTRYKEYLKEEKMVVEMFKLRSGIKPKYLNIYKYLWKMMQLRLVHISSKTNVKLKAFTNIMFMEYKEADAHLVFIRREAEKFHFQKRTS